MRLFSPLLLVILLFPSIAIGQEPCQAIVKPLERYLQIVGLARNQAEGQVAALQVEIERLLKEIERLKKQETK